TTPPRTRARVTLILRIVFSMGSNLKEAPSPRTPPVSGSRGPTGAASRRRILLVRANGERGTRRSSGPSDPLRPWRDDEKEGRTDHESAHPSGGRHPLVPLERATA